ncbi:VOC family protein [Acidaminobacter sp. JC074]|uniref:VOC family protein n=1 Tax=Acidaminobacter sp. JC074 TaxID=2530199 RepID=UPI001F0D6C51|nr:VOC family protein [Acidaminobacter sp. JC074]MCH4886858.1 VOC family protein [Acidaminobacter sp. JC074]
MLGAFSLSLTVKDIKASKAFYELLGFEKFHGDIEQKWLILKNGDVTIGLFEGMFERNIMTFNPGWNDQAEEVNPFKDVREWQKELKAKGVEFIDEVDETTEGPGNFIILDPDGNPIMLDQHR